MATAYTLCTGPIAGAVSIGKGRLLVSVQGDGVSCYDVSTQKPVQSWALGGSEQEFSSAAVYDYASNQCFAPARPRGSRGPVGKSGGSVLAWSADDTAGSITQLSHVLHLPAIHTLFPVSSTPEGEDAERQAEKEEEAAAMTVDGSGEQRGGALAVLTNGGAALCSGAEVLAETEEGRSQHTVAAAYQGQALVVVHSDPRSGDVSCTVTRVQGGQLVSEPPVQLLPPSEGCRAVAATSTAERTAVLWSDGTVAVYIVPGDKRPYYHGPGHTGSSRQPKVQRRLAGFRLPAGRQKASGGSKKRGAAAGDAEAAAAGGVSMAPMGEKQVALAGWATSSQGTTVLRLVVVETTAACVQLAQDFAAADVGLAVLDPSKPVQVESLGAGSNQLAISVGTAVLVADCSELKPPTLANLLGALAVDKAAAAMASGAAPAGRAGSGATLLSPALPTSRLGGTAAVNPAALAAARVLHPDELAALSSPFGGAARDIEHGMELEEPTEPGQWLVRAKEIIWKVKDEKADKRIAAEERRVWQAVQQVAGEAPPAALASDAALQKLLAPLLELRRSTGLLLSPRLVCKLLTLAAEHQHWGAAAAILAAQHPGTLAEVPGLAAAAADAGQLPLLEQLLQGSTYAPAAEAAALLQVLLSPPSSDAAAAARSAQHHAIQAAAADAVAAAEQAAAEQTVAQGAPAQQAQQQQQQAPATAAKVSGRRKKKKGAVDGGDSDVEDLVAATAAADLGGVDAQQQQQQQHGQQAAAAADQQQQQQQPPLLEPPGGRQRAVAACCSAAAQGFAADETCLHAAVALLRMPGPVLRGALRTLSALQSVALLRYLLRLLRNHAAVVGGLAVASWQPPLALPQGVLLPLRDQALSWVSANIDANLIKLSLQPEAQPLLQDLQQLVDEQIAEARPLVRLGGIVEQLLAQQRQQRPPAATADYSVQWLDLRVQQQQQPQPQ